MQKRPKAVTHHLTHILTLGWLVDNLCRCTEQNMELAGRPMRYLMRDGIAVTRAATGRWASEGEVGRVQRPIAP